MDNLDEALRSRLTISAVQRETGLGKDTLRVWERRYGFPMPRRDATGEREYGAADLEKLRAIKRLLDAGHRPGQLMALSIEQLQELSQRSADMARASPASDAALKLADLMEMLRCDDLAGLRGELRQAQVRLGLSAFVIEVVAPFNTLVGDAWMRGDLEIYQEHGYTETVQRGAARWHSEPARGGHGAKAAHGVQHADGRAARHRACSWSKPCSPPKARSAARSACRRRCGDRAAGSASIAPTWWR